MLKKQLCPKRIKGIGALPVSMQFNQFIDLAMLVFTGLTHKNSRRKIFKQTYENTLRLIEVDAGVMYGNQL